MLYSSLFLNGRCLTVIIPTSQAGKETEEAEDEAYKHPDNLYYQPENAEKHSKH